MIRVAPLHCGAHGETCCAGHGSEGKAGSATIATERSGCCEQMMKHISELLPGRHVRSAWSVHYFDGIAVTVSACECSWQEMCFARRVICGMRPGWRSSCGICHRDEQQAARSGPKGPKGRRFILSRHACVRLWTVYAYRVGIGRWPCVSSMVYEAHNHF